MVALSGNDKVSPPHLTRETFSGRRPADGRYPRRSLSSRRKPGLGAEGKIKSADAA